MTSLDRELEIACRAARQAGKVILEHYGQIYSERNPKPPLLFLVGETRRDIIPKTLMNPELSSDKRIEVVEEVVQADEEGSSR